MLSRRWRQVLQILGIIAVCFILLSLATYDSGDSSFSRAGSHVGIGNLGGRVGAWIADLVYQVFGYACWAVIIVPWWCARVLAGRPGIGIRRPLAYTAMVLVLATGVHLAFGTPTDASFPPGGLLGMLLGGWIAGALGHIGAWLAVGGAGAIAGTLALDFDWERPTDGVLRGVERAPSLAWLGVRGTIRAFFRPIRALCQGMAYQLRREPEEPGDELVAHQDMDPEGRPDHLPDPDQDPDSLPPAVAVGPTTSEAPSSSLLPTQARPPRAPDPPEHPTWHARRELVEVEWEPTVAGIGPDSAEDLADRESVAAPQVVATPRPPAALRPGTVFASMPRRTSADVLRPPEAPASSAFLPQARDDEPEVGDPIASRPVPPRRRKAKGDLLAVQPGLMVSGGNDDPGVVMRVNDPATPFELPTLSLLDRHERDVVEIDEDQLRSLAVSLEEKLSSFGIKGQVKAIRPGPVITTFEYLPEAGIKISRISALSDDLAMAMKALRVRIVAPIPGKGVVGIEIPNDTRQTVWVRDILASESFRKSKAILPLVLGKSVEGHPEVADLQRMPHLLLGGTTGSGKSVGINAMMLSMLYTRTPEELRIILIDPKMLEFEPYQDIPHLLHPVVTDVKLASAALRWACEEMDRRYRVLASFGTRNITSYNSRVEDILKNWEAEHGDDDLTDKPAKMPYIVIVIDELADLMMQAAKEVEESIVRLAQKARAAGVHLIVATQRPSVDVITGLIKANMPARVAFQVRSKTDGRTILDQNGAEALLGKGDMLFLPPGVSALQRIHGAFVSDDEVRRVGDFLRLQGEPNYEAEIRIEDDGDGLPPEGEYDEFYDIAVQICCDAGKASTSMIQRHLKIGYNRAARIIEQMERDGVVGPADGARPREVLAGRPSVY